MFDEAASVSRFRAALARTGTMFEADLDELESHLCDRIDALEETGLSREAAFVLASEELGEPQSVAREFAKVNPLLAWRAALFWICAGVLTVLGLRPVQELGAHAVVAGGFALRLPPAAMTMAAWAIGLAPPLLFFALAFVFVRRRLTAQATTNRGRRSSAVLRVATIVGAAVTMLTAHLASDWGWLEIYESDKWGWTEVTGVWMSYYRSLHVLAVAAPLLLVVYALRERHRAIAIADRAAGAPLFWLAVGFFVGTIRSELHVFVHLAMFSAGGAASLDAARMSALVWIVTLGSPCLLAVATYTFLRHRAPSPSRVLRARGVIVAFAIASIAGAGAVLASKPLLIHDVHLPWEVRIAGVHAWLLASIVTSCALPVLVGSLMFRLRESAMRADCDV